MGEGYVRASTANQVLKGKKKWLFYRNEMEILTLLLVVFTALTYIDAHNKK